MEAQQAMRTAEAARQAELEREAALKAKKYRQEELERERARKEAEAAARRHREHLAATRVQAVARGAQVRALHTYIHHDTLARRFCKATTLWLAIGALENDVVFLQQ